MKKYICETRNGCSCETGMGIADRAKKAENCEHFVESYKLKQLKGEIILKKYKI